MHTMYVYISHAYPDEALAHQIADSLRKEHFDVWDNREIYPGDNWAELVSEALKRADAMVVLLTPAALSAPNVSHDIGFALSGRQFEDRLVSVVAGNEEQVPRDKIPGVLNRLKVVRLGSNGNQEGFRHIAEALRMAA
jgi:hypothetical protein